MADDTDSPHVSQRSWAYEVLELVHVKTAFSNLLMAKRMAAGSIMDSSGDRIALYTQAAETIARAVDLAEKELEAKVHAKAIRATIEAREAEKDRKAAGLN